MLFRSNIFETEKDIADAIRASLDEKAELKLGFEDLRNLVSNELPKKFQAWYDDISQQLEAWKRQAEESYKKVIDHLNFDVTRN